MRDESQFRLALGVVCAALAVVRVYYQVQARRAGPVTEFEGKANIAMRVCIGLAGFALLTIYVSRPERLGWALVPLPAWFRWMGAPLGLSGVLLLLWVHRELGANFRGTLHLRQQHTLVTSGPYQWVRHPMYTSFFAIILAFALLSANWLIAVVFVGGVTLVMVSRVRKEETVMCSRFGAAYDAWAARTGRFLPKVLS